MIIHVPTVSRFVRSLLYTVAIAIVLWKAAAFVGPWILPDDPYRIPAGDALSVNSSLKSPNISHGSTNQADPALGRLLRGAGNRFKWFLLSGE